MQTEFDQNGDTTIVETVVQKDKDGNNVNCYVTRSISAEQLEKHMPMIEKNLTVSEKAEALEIIAEVKAAESD